MTFLDELKQIDRVKTVKIGKNDYYRHRCNPLSLVYKDYLTVIEIQFGKLFVSRDEWTISCDIWNVESQQSLMLKFEISNDVVNKMTTKEFSKILKGEINKKMSLVKLSKKKLF